MSQTNFWFGAVAATVVFGSAAYWARRSGGSRRLLLTTGIAATLVFVVGLFDWSRQSPRETPVATYLLLAILPTVLASTVMQALSSSRLHSTAQVLLASLAGMLAVIVALLSVFFP